MQLYLDNASTTSVDEDVKKLFLSLLDQYYASTSSLHQQGVQALHLETEAKNQIAQLLKVSPNEIYFNSGATEGNNYAIKGVAFQYQNRGKTIITTKIEHPSVLESVKQLERDFHFKAVYLDVDENGVISLQDLQKHLNQDVILVSIMYVNHEVGSIMPIHEIHVMLKKYPKIIFHSDVTQAIGKCDIDFSDLDLATMSAHKIHGMKGCGFLYKRDRVQLYPIINGHPAQNTMRAGTSNWLSNVTIALALKKAYQHLKEDAILIRETQQRLIALLNEIPQVQVNMNAQFSIPHIINFSLVNYNPEVIIRALSQKGIYVSSKSACSVAQKDQVSSTLYAMHKDIQICISSIRISLERPLSEEEIQYFIQSLKEIIAIIRK